MRSLIRYRTPGRLRVSNAVATCVGLIGCVAIEWLVEDLVAHYDADPHSAEANVKSLAFLVVMFIVPFSTLWLTLSNDVDDHCPLFLRLGGIRVGGRAFWFSFGLGFAIGGRRLPEGSVETTLGVALMVGAVVFLVLAERRWDFVDPFWEQVVEACRTLLAVLRWAARDLRRSTFPVPPRLSPEQRG